MGLLFVCTGNLCRSPFAERRTVALLDGRPGVPVGSAGTAAPVGEPMDPRTAQVLEEFGGSPDGHRARRVTDALVDDAGLVLTMQTAHRTAVLELAPGALRRTFTLLEAVALLGDLDPADDPAGLPPAEHLRAMAARLAGARATLSRPHPGFPDVDDPIGQPLAVHREVATVVDRALRSLLARVVLRGG